MRHIPILIGVGIGLAAGFGLGRVVWRGKETPSIPAAKVVSSIPNGQQTDLAKIVAASGPKLKSGKDWVPFRGNARDLLARALDIPGERDTMYFLYRALEEIPTEDLPAFAAELVGIPSTQPHQYLVLQEVQRRWTQQDPAAALAWVQGLPKAVAQQALRNAVDGFTETNPAEAVRIAKKLENQQVRREAISKIVKEMAASDPTAALALANSLDTPDARKSAVGTIFSNMIAKDPAAAYAFLRTNMPTGWENFTPGLWSKWGQMDPASALGAVAEMKSDGRSQALSYIYSAWTEKDPGAALLSAGSLPNANERMRAVSSCFSRLVRDKPDGGFRMAGTATNT